MTRLHRVASASALALSLMILPATPALAHGGSNRAVTSNYQITITSLTPAVEGLQMSIIDVDGTPQLTWNGTGNVIVEGYNGEPYLRITAEGVERNERSTATYFNQTRYINTSPPAFADDTAPPQWTRLTGERTIAWHDHRTHWMSTIPPEAVQTHPHHVIVINPDWQIPLLVNGRPVVVHGTLSWIPPPSRSAWIAAGAAFAAAVGILLFLPFWRRAVIAISIIATSAFVFDTYGYFRAASPASTKLVWVLVWPVAAVAATVRLPYDMHRQPANPTLSVSVVAIVLAVVGGIDRVDAVTHSQIYTAWPDWTARACATLCLATSAALLIRFLAYLIPTLISGPTPIVPTRNPNQSTNP